MLSPDLTDSEVDTICGGLRQNAAKVRYLQRLGVHVERKPNGRPLVSRAHYLAVRGSITTAEDSGHSAAPVGTGPRWSVPA